jgi:hypothetical protein
MKHIKIYEAIKKPGWKESGEIFWSNDERKWKTTGINERDYQIGDFVYLRVKNDEPAIGEILDYNPDMITVWLIPTRYGMPNPYGFDPITVIRKLTPEEMIPHIPIRDKEYEIYLMKKDTDKYNL